MDSTNRTDSEPSAPALRADIVGRSVQIVDPDSDRIHIDLADLPALRARLDELEAAAEQVVRVREMTDGLRALADFYDAHPELDVRVPFVGFSVYRVNDDWTDDDASIEAAAAVMGVEVTRKTNELNGDITVSATRMFGPVELKAVAVLGGEPAAVPA